MAEPPDLQPAPAAAPRPAEVRPSLARPALTRAQVAAVVIGNGLEFYDFVTFSFFAVQIGRAFFPGAGEADRLLLALATFGAGFLTRPLGGWVLGRYADRAGRRPAMVVSFTLMGAAIAGLALTPPYAAIGAAAPALAVAFRLLQGFALGGEVGPSTAFLVEAAPAHRRGFYCSLASATADGAVMTAGIVGATLAALLPADALAAWGWRAALLLGAATTPFGFLLRRRLAETLPSPAIAASVAERPTTPPLAVAATGLVLLGGATFVNYALDYMTTYAQTTLRMPPTAAFAATSVVGLSSLTGDLLSGRLSDRFGRKPVMIAPWALLLVLILPAYLLMARLRSPAALLGASAVLGLVSCVGSAAIIPWLAEALPPRMRAGGFGVVYALAISVFGGSCQLILAGLIRATGNPVSPAWFVSGAVGVSLLAMLRLRETAPPHPETATDRARGLGTASTSA